jgi:protein-L-isoaspartate(D-aspartate) O-methyltransferase
MRNETLQELLISLQRNGISDPRVLQAMARTPREMFISDSELKEYAYADEALPIECEQTISQPFVVAFMTERLHLTPDNEVLEIGTGSGYQAAILSRLARHVYTIEMHDELQRLATGRFNELGLTNITAIAGDGTRGWPEFRQFERIIVTAGTETVPEELLDQLAPCGFMVIPLGSRDDQRITLVTRCNGRIESQPLLPVRFVPLVRTSAKLAADL